MGIIEAIKQIERERGIEIGMRMGMEIKKRIEKKNHEFVENLLLHTSFDTKKIAQLVNVSENFVRKVKRTLRKKSQ